MLDFKIPFVKREKQITDITELLNRNNNKNIVIRGESGTGKTSLVRHILKPYIYNNEYTVIYIDLNSDLLSSNLFMEILLFTVWNPIEANEKALLSISKDQSFYSYINKNIWYRRGAKYLYQIITNSLSVIPTYGAIITKALDSKALDVKYSENTIDKIDYIQKYFSFICTAKKVILTIDNYQFMPSNIKIIFESCLQSIKQNFNFITIYRELDNEITLPVSFPNSTYEFKITKFTYNDIYYLIHKIYGNINLSKEEICQDCYEKTHGNLKEIELYIKDNHEYLSKGTFIKRKSKSLKQVLIQLPELQKYLVLLSAVFPAGIKLEYVNKLLNKFLVVANESFLFDEMKRLITLGYIIINSRNNNILKPSHEKITISISEIQNEEDFLDFYKNLTSSIEELISTKKMDSDYVYLLHCIIGLYNTNQLISRMNYLIDLIRIEYEKCSYYYIVSIYKQIQDITENLPDICISKILDSCQKTSEFSLGLSLMARLKSNNSTLYSKYCIYEIKYLTQSYDFLEALNALGNMDETSEIILYKLNILQHIGKNSEAINYITKIIEEFKEDKWHFMILRNSAHYFTYKEASKNLNRCREFFSKYGTIFEEATILNNLGVINVWDRNFTLASEYLLLAENLHKSISSNEIFEVYCNIGVMEFIRGNTKTALEYNERAKAEVPQSLDLDHIILYMNEIIYKCTLGDISIDEAYNNFKNLLFNHSINKDPWVRFQVIYNLSNLEDTLGLAQTEKPDEYYVKKNEANLLTCFEVFQDTKIEGELIRFSLSLSPNWRY